MSFIETFDTKQLTQLKADLQNTRTTLITRGWTSGYLIDYHAKDAATRGSVCMTGAAACTTEGDRFIQHILDTWSKTAPSYRWSMRTRRLLQVLSEVGCETFEFEGRQANNFEDVLNNIFCVNDGEIEGKEDALKWVDAALELVDEHLALVPAAPKVESAEPIINRLLGDKREEPVLQPIE